MHLLQNNKFATKRKNSTLPKQYRSPGTPGTKHVPITTPIVGQRCGYNRTRVGGVSSEANDFVRCCNGWGQTAATFEQRPGGDHIPEMVGSIVYRVSFQALHGSRGLLGVQGGVWMDGRTTSESSILSRTAMRDNLYCPHVDTWPPAHGGNARGWPCQLSEDRLREHLSKLDNYVPASRQKFIPFIWMRKGSTHYQGAHMVVDCHLLHHSLSLSTSRTVVNEPCSQRWLP